MRLVDPITTYQASKKYRLSTNHLRSLLTKGMIVGRQQPTSSARNIWLIDEKSLKKYLKTPRKPGRKPSK